MKMTLTVESLKAKMLSGERVQIIDVRSAGEYAAGHIPGAINVPFEQLENRLDDLHDDDPVILVCQSGNRAAMCHEHLKNVRDDAWILEGGTAAWIEKGNAAVNNATSRWSIERQVRLVAGILVLSGTLLSVFVAPGWIYLAMFLGAGLTFAGISNFCGMAALFAHLPWNKPRKSNWQASTSTNS